MQFSIYFGIILVFLEPDKHFRFYFEFEMPFDFVFAITGAIATVSLRPWQDLLQEAKSHVLGTFRDDGKLTNLIRFR